MQFQVPLVQAILVRRYKRFLADVRLMCGQVITVHCPNPGAMIGLAEPGQTIWLNALPQSITRKYAYRWELVQVGSNFVGINTQMPNILVAEALQHGRISQVVNYTHIKPEVIYGQGSRIDFLLQNDHLPTCYLEIKNVHLKRGTLAEFPDCATTRGVKHLQQLSKMIDRGMRAVVLYIVQRQDCDGFTVAHDLDPKYAQIFQNSCQAGVEHLCYQCIVSPKGITIDQQIPILHQSEV